MYDDIAPIENSENDSAAQRLAAALAYVRRGWPIVPLHDVVMGYCSCGDTSATHAEKSGGKHPLAKGWPASAIETEEILAPVFNGRPSMNFGIKTGIKAGIWALDVDPKNGGDLRLAELEKEHGALPDTYTVRTGSGGRHLVFSLPEDFTPTNSPGSLPEGLDVRGEGGFIVAAPCRSGVGPYEVLLNLPVVGASDWLLDMIRPRMPAEVEHRAALEHWNNPLAIGQSDRLVRYAYAAAVAELSQLAQAPCGRRGWTAHKVACSLIELVNSPWSGISEEVAKGWFAQASAQAMAAGGGFDEHEAWSSWGSAARKIGARGRAAPDAMAGGVQVPWEQLGGVPPFSSPDSRSSREFPIIPASGSLNGNPAQGQNDEVPTIIPDIPIMGWMSGRALSELPPPQWLIKGWIVRDSTCWVVGRSNDGKSLVVLDQAMHIALGRAWHGQRVHKGRVGYVVAEGATGMGQRYKGWCKRHNDGQDVDGIEFLPLPVQVSDTEAWDRLITDVRAKEFDLVILDTQARVTVGLEENSAKEMGQFVEQVERLRRCSALPFGPRPGRTGTTVLIVHHLGKAGGSARGSGSIYGAAQTELTVSRSADIVTVTTTKQKDAPFAAPLMLQLVSENLGQVVHEGSERIQGWVVNAEVETITAGVLIAVDEADAIEWQGLSAKAKLIKIMQDTFPALGGTKAEIRGQALKRGIVEKTFLNIWGDMVKDGSLVSVVINDRPTSNFNLKTISGEVPAHSVGT